MSAQENEASAPFAPSISRGPRQMPDAGAVAVDFESFYDTKDKYSLKLMDPFSYVHDRRFDAYLVSIVSDAGEVFVGRPVDFCWGSLSGKLLVAHNAAFDGMVLNRLVELGIVPDFERDWVDTADLAAYLGAPRNLQGAAKHLLGVEMSKAVRAAMDGRTLQQALLAGDGPALLDYAADDSRICMRLWLEHGSKWPAVEREISRCNRIAGWDGVCIDRADVEAGLAKLRRVRSDAERALPWTDCPDSRDNRPAGSLPALRQHALSLGLPVPASFKKDDPGMMAWVDKYAGEHPFIKARLDLASVTPHIARLESMLALADADDRLRFSLMYFGAHCLTGDHEVLTPVGWVRLDAWAGGSIAQWSQDGSIRFLPATHNMFRNSESLAVLLDAPHAKALMTLGHTVPSFGAGARGRFKALKSEALLSIRAGAVNIPRTGTCNSGSDFDENRMRVLAAVQADGHYTEDGILQFCLRKPRKVSRVQEILSAAGIKFSGPKEFPSTPGQFRVSVPRRFLPEWLGPDKKHFGPHLLNSSASAKAAFVSELRHWDGFACGTGDRTFCYSSSDRGAVEWAATLAHLCGRTAGRIGVRECDGDSEIRRGTQYVVTIGSSARRTRASVNPRDVFVVSAPEAVFCPSTETGFFLMRYHGIISVTGNTGRASAGRDDGSQSPKFNVLNLTKDPNKTFGVDMRGMVRPWPGYKFVIFDYAQIEARILQWLAGNNAFLDILRVEGNIYQAAAKAMGWFPMDGKDLKKKDTRTYQLSKSCTLGLGFRLSGPKFLLSCEKQKLDLGMQEWTEDSLDRRTKFIISNQMRVDRKDPDNYATIAKFLAADAIVQKWRNANAAVVSFWHTLEDELRRAALAKVPVHYFVLPSGRPKPYFNPHISIQPKAFVDPETGVEETGVEKRLSASVIAGQPPVGLHGGVITENIVQATARDIMYYAAMAVVRESRGRWKFPWNAYDEAIFLVPDADVASALAVIPGIMCGGPHLSWAEGLPLEVEGGASDRYMK